MSGLAGPSDAEWTQLTQTIQNSNAREAGAQKQIEEMDDAAKAAMANYRGLLLELEGLNTYNEQLQTVIDEQRTALKQTRKQLEQTAHLDRHLVPLMERMYRALEGFIAGDLPFLNEERQERLARLRRVLDHPELSLADKYRSLHEAFQIELDYGRTVETYSDTLEIDDQLHSVTVLRIGRVALFTLSADHSKIMQWDAIDRQWEESDGDAHELQQAIRIAKKQVAPDLLVLPITRPQPALPMPEASP